MSGIEKKNEISFSSQKEIEQNQSQNQNNENTPQSFLSDFSKINLSYDQNQILKCCGIYENKNSETLNEFKLKFFKKALNLEEGEKISGKLYEDIARKTFRLMLLLIIKNEVILENPNNIDNRILINFYLKYLNNFSKSNNQIPIFNILNENLNKHFEIDILYELKEKKLEQFLLKYKRHILIENITKEKENTNEFIFKESNNEYLTLMIEVARDIISQAGDKLRQISNYIKVIAVMNNISNFLLNQKNINKNIILEEYHNIIEKYCCSEIYKKIFILISDGDYTIISHTMKTIIIPLLDKYSTEKIDHVKIKNEINAEYEKYKNKEYKDIYNEEIFIENIFNCFLIFHMLNVNKIKYFLLYIGDILENSTNTINKYFGLALEREKEYIEKLLNFIKIKNKNCLNIKAIYKNLKQLILKFEKKLENFIIIEKGIYNSLEKDININNLDGSFNKLVEKIESTIKIKLYLILCFKKNDQLYNEKIKNSKNMAKQLFGKFYELQFDQIDEDIEKLWENIKKNKNKNIIYIINEQFTFAILGKMSSEELINANILFLAYSEQKLQKSRDIPDSFFNNIDYFTNSFINDFISLNKYKFDKNELLNNTNLFQKLNNDLNLLFDKKVYYKFDIINFTKSVSQFKLVEKKKKELLDNFSEMVKIFNFEEEGIIKGLENIFETNLDKLIENIYCKIGYYFCFHIIKKKINEIIKKHIQSNLEIYFKQ